MFGSTIKTEFDGRLLTEPDKCVVHGSVSNSIDAGGSVFGLEDFVLRTRFRRFFCGFSRDEYDDEEYDDDDDNDDDDDDEFSFSLLLILLQLDIFRWDG